MLQAIHATYATYATNERGQDTQRSTRFFNRARRAVDNSIPANESGPEMSDWDLFIARLSPEAVELERFNMPDADELPGSPADKRMRREHHARSVAYWYRQKFPSAPDVEIAALVQESATVTHDTFKAGKYKRNRAKWLAVVAQHNNINRKAS